MDYYTAQFAKARDGHKVYWDRLKQAARHVMTISKSVQSMISYVMQI